MWAGSALRSSPARPALRGLPQSAGPVGEGQWQLQGGAESKGDPPPRRLCHRKWPERWSAPAVTRKSGPEGKFGSGVKQDAERRSGIPKPQRLPVVPHLDPRTPPPRAVPSPGMEPGPRNGRPGGT